MRTNITKTTWSVPPELVRTAKQRKKLLQMFDAFVPERKVPEAKIQEITAKPVSELDSFIIVADENTDANVNKLLTTAERLDNCCETLPNVKSTTVRIRTKPKKKTLDALGHYSETMSHVKVSAVKTKRHGVYMFPLTAEHLIAPGILPEVTHVKAYPAVVAHLRSKTPLKIIYTSKPKKTPKRRSQGQTSLKATPEDFPREADISLTSETGDPATSTAEHSVPVKAEKPVTPKVGRPRTPKPEKPVTPKARKPVTPKTARSVTPKVEKLKTPKPRSRSRTTPKADKPVTPKPRKSSTPKAEKPEKSKPEQPLPLSLPRPNVRRCFVRLTRLVISVSPFSKSDSPVQKVVTPSIELPKTASPIQPIIPDTVSTTLPSVDMDSAVQSPATAFENISKPESEMKPAVTTHKKTPKKSKSTVQPEIPASTTTFLANSESQVVVQSVITSYFKTTTAPKPDAPVISDSMLLTASKSDFPVKPVIADADTTFMTTQKADFPAQLLLSDTTLTTVQKSDSTFQSESVLAPSESTPKPEISGPLDTDTTADSESIAKFNSTIQPAPFYTITPLPL